MFLRFILISLFVVGSLSAQDRTTLSFASDDNHDGPTFTLRNTQLPNTIYIDKIGVDLIVDKNEDNNGGLIKYQTIVKFEGKLEDHQAYPYSGGYLHSWRVNGYFTFFHDDGTQGHPELLTVKFENAVLTSFSSSYYSTGYTMTLQASEDTDPSIAFIPDTLLKAVGVDKYDFEYFENFAFTLTNIKTKEGRSSVPISRSGYFREEWTAEGSFSCAGVNLKK